MPVSFPQKKKCERAGQMSKIERERKSEREGEVSPAGIQRVDE